MEQAALVLSSEGEKGVAVWTNEFEKKAMVDHL